MENELLTMQEVSAIIEQLRSIRITLKAYRIAFAVILAFAGIVSGTMIHYTLMAQQEARSAYLAGFQAGQQATEYNYQILKGK